MSKQRVVYLRKRSAKRAESVEHKKNLFEISCRYEKELTAIQNMFKARDEAIEIRQAAQRAEFDNLYSLNQHKWPWRK